MWESYLEEQKAIAAPISLFQDVSWILLCYEELVSQTRDSPPNSGLLLLSVSDIPQRTGRVEGGQTD